MDLLEPSVHTAMLSELPTPQLPMEVALPATVTLLLTSVRTLAPLGNVIVMCCPAVKAPCGGGEVDHVIGARAAGGRRHKRIDRESCYRGGLSDAGECPHHHQSPDREQADDRQRAQPAAVRAPVWRLCVNHYPFLPVAPRAPARATPRARRSLPRTAKLSAGYEQVNNASPSFHRRLHFFGLAR